MKLEMRAVEAKPESPDPLENLLGYELRRASAVMMADLGASLAPAALRPTEATILILIHATPVCTQSDIGRRLGIARANMAPLMAALTRRGFIAKSPVDGRSQALDLTPAGRMKVIEAQAIIAAHERRFQSKVDPAIRNALFAVLKALQRG